MSSSERSAWGTVVAGFGRTALVRPDGGGAPVAARTANRRIQVVAGDRVELRAPDVIASVAPRRNVLARSSGARTKLIAANFSQVVLLAACEPAFSDELLARVLVAARRAGACALVVLNKVDLVETLAQARARLAPFRAAGIEVLEIAARRDAGPLRARLSGHRSVLVGESGMGKSTLVRALVPDAEVRIGEISRFLGTGRHTTTAARLYALDARSEIVDTPGLSEFGLAGLSAHEIAEGFPEFAPHAARCRYRDCRHLAEPDCAVQAAAQAGLVPLRRLELYRRIVAAP
ncbi:MAG: ribosome small subunit-dependent GTPase A [Burkholderiales bacterium]|nr:ribosome small subunit-dependent GTPase A [Burkholderiales bacterium]